MPFTKCLVCIVLAAVSSLAFAADISGEPIVIAHRGASGYLPEHTLEAYAMAYAQGADYIEPDVVLTKDGTFICLHDIHLEATTDVEERFPDRKRGDGKWYALDFTLEEIRTLRVHERLEKRFPKGKSVFYVPTFTEMIELIQGLNASTGKNVGIYPELKAPAWHRGEGAPMEAAFMKVVNAYGYDNAHAKIFVQCFEQAPLRMMREELGSPLPQIFLMGGGDTTELLNDAGLTEIAAFANGIGPNKSMVDRDPNLVNRAHKHGLKVHPYTLRADALPKKYDTYEDEASQFFAVYKVDGLFTDFPDRAKNWLKAQ